MESCEIRTFCGKMHGVSYGVTNTTANLSYFNLVARKHQNNANKTEEN